MRDPPSNWSFHPVGGKIGTSPAALANPVALDRGRIEIATRTLELGVGNGHEILGAGAFVQVTVAEDLGTGGRAGYYDKAGAMIDMIQSHLLQVLAFVAMEPPSSNDADAIRDEKVLKFKVDYNDVRPQFKAIETELDEKKLSAAENKQALLHPDRIREILRISQDPLSLDSPVGEEDDSTNQGWEALVWFSTSSVMSRMPRRCSSRRNTWKSARVP